MEALRSSETMVTNYHATRCHNPRDYNVNRNLCQNITSYTACDIYVLNCTGHFDGTKRVAACATVLFPASLCDGNSTQHETSLPAQATKSTVTHFLETHLYIALPSTASYPKLTLSFMISDLKSIHISHISNAFYMSNPPHLLDLIIVIVLCEAYKL